MEVRIDVRHFSAFVLELYERSLLQDLLSLFNWGVEELARTVGSDSYLSASVEVRKSEIGSSGAVSYVLPTNYYELWPESGYDDPLTGDGVKKAVGGPEGVFVISDRYHIARLPGILADDAQTPISLVLSVHLVARNGKPMSGTDTNYLLAALDHVRFALQRSKSIRPGVASLLVDSGGRILASSAEAFRMLHDSRLDRKVNLRPDLLYERVPETGLMVEKSEESRLSGVPISIITLRSSDRCAGLTSRERQIALSITDGLTHKEIARALQISPATVRNHTQAILTKLGIRNKLALSKIINTETVGSASQRQPTALGGHRQISNRNVVQSNVARADHFVARV